MLRSGDLLVHSGHVLAVVSIAAMAVRMLPLDRARARLAYWRAVVLLCLALPFLPVAQIAPGDAAALFGPAAAIGLIGASATTMAPAWLSLGQLVPWVLLTGVVARLVWLAVGAVLLRRMRTRSTPAALRPDLESLRARLAPRSEVRWAERLTQPVTFGVRRPVVLLPPSFSGLSPEAQHAIACHEFLHVARHDWASSMLDEALRSMYWFHPAMRWALAHIELSREQLIDELVVQRGAARRAYMDALLAFAEADGVAASALPLLRRRHLASRIKHLSEGNDMSTTRLVCTAAALSIVIVMSTWGVTRAFPLGSTGGAVQQQSVARFEVRLAETVPESGLTEVLVPGSGQRIYLHQNAVVTNVDVAAARVAQASDGSGFNVGIEFNQAGSEKMAAATRAHIGKPVAILVAGQVIAAPILRSVITDSAVITGSFTKEEAERIAAGIPTVADVGRPPDLAAASPQTPKPRLIRDVKPQYPREALAQKVAGVVIVETTIGVDGIPTDVRAISGPELLRQAAVDAIKQWRWDPVPHPVTVQCEMSFTVA